MAKFCRFDLSDYIFGIIFFEAIFYVSTCVYLVVVYYSLTYFCNVERVAIYAILAGTDHII